MTTTADIEAALRQALLPGQKAAAAELARLVEAVREGRLTQEQAQIRLGADPALAQALAGLAGQQIEIAGRLISFEGSQTGDVTIRDVAGRDLITLRLNIGMQQNVSMSGGTVGKVVGEEHNTYYTYSTPGRSPQEQRNRRATLTKVRTIWIEGLLNRSLTEELRIDLNLTDRPDLLHLPLNAVVQELERPPEALPPGVPISQVFDQVGGELLILGAPGAGKTTLLLELLRDLLQRAEQDEAHPIPVVFPLSSWAAEQKPLAEWLVDQLNVIYDVPKKTGQGWVAENEILPLLDGLDEVAAEHRNACVEAINKYRQELGGLAPTAVVSRIVDYEALKGRLRLRGAALVEALTRQQVEEYLVRVGEPLRAVRDLVESDPEVMELLDSPLMLNVVSLAFRDASPETLRAGGTIEERRGRLWESYVERMLARKGKLARYSRKQTTNWLYWLSWQMRQNEQTVYYIKGMQPEWLQQPWKWRHTIVVMLLLGFGTVLVGGLVGGLVGSLLEGWGQRLPGQLESELTRILDSAKILSFFVIFYALSMLILMLGFGWFDTVIFNAFELKSRPIAESTPVEPMLC